MSWWLGALSPVLMLYLWQDFASKHQTELCAFISMEAIDSTFLSAVSFFLTTEMVHEGGEQKHIGTVFEVLLDELKKLTWL